MRQTDIKAIAAYLDQSRAVMEAAFASPVFLEAACAVADAWASALEAGGKVLLFGNGGSAGDAQHIAGELLSRFRFDRAPLPALALTVDSSVLTAIGNDFGFDQLFERQVRGLARSGDVLIAISTSRRSPNVLAALKAARESGVVTIGFTGSTPSDMTALCDHLLAAPTDKTPLIQQIHIVAAHAICTCVEDALFGPRPA